MGTMKHNGAPFSIVRPLTARKNNVHANIHCCKYRRSPIEAKRRQYSGINILSIINTLYNTYKYIENLDNCNCNWNVIRYVCLRGCPLTTSEGLDWRCGLLAGRNDGFGGALRSLPPSRRNNLSQWVRSRRLVARLNSAIIAQSGSRSWISGANNSPRFALRQSPPRP